MQTSLVGSYGIYAGLVVLIASRFGINLVSADVEVTISTIIVLAGAIYSHLAHKSAIATVQGIR